MSVAVTVVCDVCGQKWSEPDPKYPYLTLDWMRDLEDFARRLYGAGWRDLTDVGGNDDTGSHCFHGTLCRECVVAWDLEGRAK